MATQNFKTLPAGTTRSHSHMAYPILDQNNLVQGFSASGGDTYPLAQFALDSNNNVIGLTGPGGTVFSFVGGLQTGVGNASANVTALQNALNLGGTVKIDTPGLYYVNATMTIPSNTTLYIGTGVTLKYAPSMGRCNFFVNANTATGDSNITITGGGILDGNYQNIGATVSDVRLMAVRLTNVTNSLIENISVINCLKYAIHITKCTTFKVRNIFVNTQSVGGDGVHVHGNSNDGLIENISGISGDDFIAMNVKDVSSWLDPVTPALSIGPITNVIVRKISGSTYSGNSGNVVAVYSNVTGSPTNISAASWTAGVVTVTCAGFTGVANQFVQIAGVTPATFNGVFRMLSAASGTFTFAMDSTPGTYTSGGTVDASYEISGITVEDVKPTQTNAGNVIYLNSFPSPSQGGAINDIVVRNVRAIATSGRVLEIGTSIGFLDASELRHNKASGSNTEFVYLEPSLTCETLLLSDLVNELPYTGTLGALCKINSPVKILKVANTHLQLSGTSTSGFMLTNSGTNTALVFDSVEFANYSCLGLQSAAGLAAIELGSSAFPQLSIANFHASNLVAAIKGNGGTLASNITINGLQVKNITGGSAVIVLYAAGVVTNITVSGFIPRANAFGAYNFLINNATGGATTFVTATDMPNYTLSLNWFDAGTPGSGSALYANGNAIRCDVTKLTRWDGCIVNNTNAAAGTLATAGLVSCQGTAANSWSLMSTPTLKY